MAVTMTRLVQRGLVLFSVAALFGTAASKPGCDVCTKMVGKFESEMEKNKNSNSGSGNTDWEESRGIKWDTSEARLAEIMEHVCGYGKSGDAKCLEFLDDGEEYIEKWWANRKAGKNQTSLHKYVCIRKAKVCCDAGKFGKKCDECPGGAATPCSNHGTCKGAGDRKGKGKCKCETGYIGKRCAKCGPLYYKEPVEDEVVNGSLPYACAACSDACAKGCKGAGDTKCTACASGYAKAEGGEACTDLDECASADTFNCTATQFCVNNAGGYSCENCDAGCAPEAGCIGAGADQCTDSKCAAGYELTGAACTDVDECASAEVCAANTFCTNSQGSHSCSACNAACAADAGCTNGLASGCKGCAAGWVMPEGKEAGCEDVDECANPKSCEEGMTCTNSPGSFSCDCQEPRKLIDGKCVAYSDQPDATTKDEL